MRHEQNDLPTNVLQHLGVLVTESYTPADFRRKAYNYIDRLNFLTDQEVIAAHKRIQEW